MNQAQAAKMTVKVPPDVRQWLEAQAAYHVTSMTAEVIRVIRDRMARDQQKVAG